MLENYEWIKSILDDQPYFIVRWKEDGVRTYANRVYCQYFNLTQDEAIGTSFFSLISDEDIKQVKKRIKRLSPTHPKSTDIHRALLPNGKTAWQEWIDIGVYDKRGNLIEYQSTGRDISDLKKAEEKLAESEENLTEMINAIASPMLIISTDGTIYKANMAYCQIFNHTSESIVGENAFSSLPKKVAQTRRGYLNQVLKNKKPIRFTDSRDNRYYDNRVFPVLNEKHEVIRMAIYAEDVTEIRNADLELRKAYEQIKQLKERLQEENVYLQEEIKLDHNFDEIIYKSREISSLLNKVQQVATTDATVLILGESGTGKELIARAIHNISGRGERPIIKVNCAALPKDLIESELFGHEAGAFTGAIKQKKGRFDLADKGTIFLDEIGELPMNLQAKLLRVLQEGEYERLGGTQTLKADVRVIAATNRNLEKAIKENEFRLDLFYRLNVFPITLPPLRERKEDIPLLVQYLLNKFNRKLNRFVDTVTKNTMNILQNYEWPGNIRELENVLERAVILSQGNILNIEDSFVAVTSQSSSRMSLNEVERDHILSVLEIAKWKIDGNDGAARVLKLAPSTLRDKMKKLKIEKPLVKRERK